MKNRRTRLHSHSNIEEGSLPRPPSSESIRKDENPHQLLWSLMSSYLPTDKKSIQRSIVNHVEYSLAGSRYTFNDRLAYLASASSLRDRLIENWNDTVQFFHESHVKRVSYLSFEYLMGRAFRNALTNVDLETTYNEALSELGFDLNQLYAQEPDAALGNGGLGRLAACFLDSMATLDLPAWGYGIRYTYGIFEQVIVDGHQIEQPDYWLTHGNPWEIVRKDITYPVRFYGHVTTDPHTERRKWEGGEIVEAEACDHPIPGYDTRNTINLRLWKATPAHEFDLVQFNHGQYAAALEARQRAQTITSVLYPNDSTNEGKELRLKQQYFFVCATLQDLMRDFDPTDWRLFGKKNAIQLNDTHPSIAIPELFRVLMDDHDLTLDEAWNVSLDVFAYTNHTVLPEALETWTTDLIGKLLPRHLEIMYEINWHFLSQVAKKYPHDMDRIARMSIIGEGPPKHVRMSNLSLVCCHKVNGVAALHSDIIKTEIFRDFYDMWPEKFINITNGVTPRRWIYVANKSLANLLTEYLGSDCWLKDLSLLSELRKHVDDQKMRRDWCQVKQKAKAKLAAYIYDHLDGLRVPVNALYDIHVKRIHEYKRQLMNALYCVYRYLKIKSMSTTEKQKLVPRVTIFSGKAASGYHMAKLVIKFINDIAAVVNHDPFVGDSYKVVFLPNYKVSSAEIIIPASDISQHISTAGTEASGTRLVGLQQRISSANPAVAI